MTWYDPSSWFDSSSSDPTTTPLPDTGTVTQVDSPTAKWNPDIGWVDPVTGQKVEVPTNYGMVQGVEGTSMGGFNTADPNFSFDKYMSGEYQYDPSSTNLGNAIANIIGKVGTSAFNTMKANFTDPKTGNTNWGQLAALGGGLLGLANPSWANTKQQPVGYQGGIPTYSAVRQQVPETYDPNRRPGSRGQEYMTDTQYVNPSNVATAQATAAQQATEMAARNKARTAQTKAAPTQAYAAGGIANLAHGNYLAGATDGMADKIPATIAGKQPAKLSHGEFVIPADVVSHLGNGNSEAGAERLYSMMDKIRTARTGTKKQGKQINPNKYLPG